MSVWKKLLETARYAPSPHNVQPWRLRILSDETAELLIEKLFGAEYRYLVFGYPPFIKSFVDTTHL
jgi:nitroreductase